MLDQWQGGELVWFDPSVGHWLPGEVLEVHQAAGVLTVQAHINGKPQTFALTEGEASVRRRQDLGTNGVEDMTQLSDLHEAALLWNLKIRYDKNLIYTYVGSILVSVNPYRMFDSNYGLEAAQRYKGRLLGELPPHLFAIGAAAHASLPAPQVVVISGESGSGKTESTKLVMQYLAAVSPAARGQALVTEQILEAAPLLEAFGNARTARNDNSSRFGKYLEVYFKHGAIVGAKVTQYLLEKSRIVTQASGERNYHVFYEMLGGLSTTDKQKYGLLDADKYFYLNQGGGDCAPGRCNADWAALLGAMQVLGVGDAERDGIIKILASVLHLGNIYFHRRQLRHGQEGVEVGSEAEIKWAAHLLQISASGLQRTLTTRVTEARGERVHSPLGIDQALDARDAFAKALYSSLFNWLVTRVNSIVHKGGLHDASRICLLDIFGFEDLAENSFEQLCINFASESLQLYFNKHVFKLEQQEYQRERLEWTPLGWLDNTPVIQLLGKKPVGIMHLLDDESNFPRASDSSFLEKCHYNHALNEHYCRPRVGGHEFGIRHFAGQVWYSVDGFLDKNRDALRLDIVDLLASSREPLVTASVRPLLNEAQQRTLPRGANGRFVTMKPRTPTVAARFSDSLQQLLDSMAKCNPWFIRCFKPNSDKVPARFDMPVVLQQLRCSGMLDTIKIRQCGYPVRLKFQPFVERYRYLLGKTPPRGAPYRDLCRAILATAPETGAPGPDYQLGATRVFLREGLQRYLESRRGSILTTAALTIQRHVRGNLARKRYKAMRTSAVTIQKHWRGHRYRKKYRDLRRGTIKAQALWRGKSERKRFSRRKQEWQAEKAARERARQRAAQRDSQLAQQRAAVHHLEIPAELAFIFSKLEGYSPPHTERHLVKVVGGVTGSPPPISLPPDLDQFAFGKFCSVYFKGSELGVRREPITAPFLSKAAARDQDFHDAVALFKLVLRWSNDPQLQQGGSRERALADYVAHKGLGSRGLRDELLVQLCNQAWRNDRAERIWQLMAHCLSVFAPSSALAKYLLKFVTDHAPAGQRTYLQRKLLRAVQRSPRARALPPSLLEWRSERHRADMALPLVLPDGTVHTVAVDSWTTCEEAAAEVVNTLGIPPEGWTVVLDDQGQLYDTNGFDYVLDLISELELCPAFPAERTDLLKTGTKSLLTQNIIDNDDSPSPRRPQVPPPAPPPQSSTPRKMSREVEREPSRKSSQEVLSRESALNERYFEAEKVRSRSLDNLLEPATGNSSPPLAGLGLSQSRLNERYRSVEQLSASGAPIEPIFLAAKQQRHQESEIDFEYPDVSSVGAASSSIRGGAPRFIKSQYAGKKAPPGSHSSRAHIEKSEPRSSAMSDTSEAPSLASHVRRVRVPSQASDVDQFLDELFSPVLDGTLDELSDARSLAASIRGDRNIEELNCEKNQFNYSDFNDFLSLDELDENLESLGNITSLITNIRGGGKTKPGDNGPPSRSSSVLDQEVASFTSRRLSDETAAVDDYISDLFQPIFVNNSLKRLTEKDTLVDSIKGGGAAPQPQGATANGTSYRGFSPLGGGSSILTPQPMMVPMLTSPSDGSFIQSGYSLQSANSPTDLAAYQQNLQRAFLQSAMAQNIQIQQQLLAQNQALQQLLTQQDVELTSPVPTSSTPVTRRTSTRGPTTSPGANDHFLLKSRKQSSESNVSRGAPPPPPPPMPPPVDESDPSESRPFLDPYGRAKTVRIGKWRWPPPQGGSPQENGEDFMQFKLRQNHQRKTTPGRQDHGHMNNRGASVSPPGNQTQDDGTSSVDWDELDMGESVLNSVPAGLRQSSSKRAFEVGAARPSPGSVGKLKLSSEMRQRLEMVTANHSVRSSSSKVNKPPRAVNKLEDTRRMMLEQQLGGGGRWDTLDGAASPEPRPLTAPPPPPPPVGPHSLPPAPPGPAPPPPIRPPGPVEPTTVRETSYMAQRQDRDTFGVTYQRSSFSMNWEMQTEHHERERDRERERNKERERRVEDRPTATYRTHQLREQRERKSSAASTVQTQQTDKIQEKIEIDDWPDFLKPVMPPPTAMGPQQSITPPPPSSQSPGRLMLSSGAAACLTYNRVAWQLRVRKEVFSPAEGIGPPGCLQLLFLQVARDALGVTPCLRLQPSEKRAATAVLSGYGVTPDTILAPHRAHVKRHLLELARSWPLYFARLFIGTAAPPMQDIQVIAVGHWGIHLARREASASSLRCIRSLPLAEIGACSASRPSTVALDTSNGRLLLHTSNAQQFVEFLSRYCTEYRQHNPPLHSQMKSPGPGGTSHTSSAGGHQHSGSPSSPTPMKERAESQPAVASAVAAVAAESRVVSHHHHREQQQQQQHSSSGGREQQHRVMNGVDHGGQPPGSPPPPTGRHSLLQFAMQHFRQSAEFEAMKMDTSIKSKEKEKRKEWTWKQQTDLVKWQSEPLSGPLLRLDPALIPLGLECFECILRYCGDLQPGANEPPIDEVRCVYTVLMHCHKHTQLRDEVYCQLMKQTTSNKSQQPDSLQRAWRLLSIVAAYFACGEMLSPVLTEHLQAAAGDRRRACHGTAAVCLANLRKTQRCGGRKNVPSVEEVTAVSAGRSARRQIYRLPGGAERVVNTRCSTVVADVIAELCAVIGVDNDSERQEFSLYCIVQGDAFTMPLAADEYILDVTTELHKAGQPFYLIFCRSVWHHPLRSDASPLYTEVLFNQVAPDYLEGLLLKLGNGTSPLPTGTVREMALVAALLHRAADLQHTPALKEVKFLLPRPVLGLREPAPQQWLALVQAAWPQAAPLSPSQSKRRALHVLSNWSLFGSSFFAVKRVVGGEPPAAWRDHILALNRHGVHFLDLATHETVQHWPFAEVISTRKVRSEDGALFLDMKCGSLLQQRVTRLQTEQAHEISRLVRQYITLAQTQVVQQEHHNEQRI